MSARRRAPGARSIYELLQRALPREVRRRFGNDMAELFVTRLEEAGGSVRRRALVWLRAIGDIGVQSVAMRVPRRSGGEGGMRALLQDLAYGVRSAVGSPGLAIAAVLTLGLGVAASTATFSVVHAVLLRPLPFDDPDALVVVWPEVNANKAMTLMAEERMASLDAVAGLSGWTLTLTGEGQPQELTGLQASPGYFDLLGVAPMLGRTFRSEEDLPGRAGVVILSHPFWVRAFGADSSVVGRVVALGGADYERREVIGVMPPGAETLLETVDVWIPLEGERAQSVAADDTWYVNERVARLVPGATLARANAEVRAYADAVQREIPDHFSVEQAAQATVQPLRAYLARDVGQAVWVALGAVGLVLLIGCFNVANLLLARGDARARDLSVRAALGAGRLRLTRMLLAETTVLGAAGGAVGIAGAVALVRVIVRLAPPDFPGITSVSVNPAVLAFAVGVTSLATVTAGLVPAIRAGRSSASASLAGGARGAAGNAGGRMTRLLVSGQVALAVIVAVGSGLMLRSLGTLLAVDPVIDGAGVLAFKANPPTGRYPDGEAFLRYYERVVEVVGALPGVESVGAIHLLPGTTSNWMFPTHPEGYSVEEGAPTPNTNFRAVRADYFETVRVPLVEGRLVSDADRADTEPVAVVNESFASRFWPRESPIGKSVSIFSATGTRHRIVGVVADVHQHGLEIEPTPEMYYPHGQVPFNQMSMWVVARARSGDALSLAAPIEEAVWSLDSDVPITGIMQLDASLGASTKRPRFLTALLTVFGALAVGLCAVGVFGVTTYTSGRRRPEFGVRIALGSSRTRVVRSAVHRTLLPVLGGLALGLLLAAATSRLLTTVLYGVEPSDPITYAAVAVGLGLVGICAAVVPAWRASHVDPVTVLGSD